MFIISGVVGSIGPHIALLSAFSPSFSKGPGSLIYLEAPFWGSLAVMGPDLRLYHHLNPRLVFQIITIINLVGSVNSRFLAVLVSVIVP